SECLPAETRQISPGLHIFTSNALVHKTILDLVPFDDGFKGWGWEDVDWGIRIAEKFPIHHIDNTATHLGIDRDEDLIRKYGGSGSNFARLIEKHPQLSTQMKLAGLVQRLRWLPFPGFWAVLAKRAAASKTIPIRLRLKALKAFRAFSYVRDRS
ncbi:MAG: glycosyltransferase family 2 protein, partial [Pseudomonadota bacterium]